jgi:hypothetical protein
MDELEWLRKNSPPTAPSRDVTQSHRTQLRAAIASEGADGPRPRRPRRRLRSRHRVLVTTVVVLALCAVGAGVVALTSSGGDDGGPVGAPAASGATSTATAPTCPGALPADFAIPTGFTGAVAGPAPESSDPVAPGQQVSYSSSSAGKTRFEIRWPADSPVQKQFAYTPAQQRPGDKTSSASSDTKATIDANGIARRRSVFTFPGQVTQCQTVEVTVYGTNADVVNSLSDAFMRAPYRSSEPLVTTTGAAASTPAVAACEGATQPSTSASATPAVATVDGKGDGQAFTKPADALADFLATRPDLVQHGYAQLQLPDGSIAYAKEVRPSIVVTAVHVVSANDTWTVSDWSASGC